VRSAKSSGGKPVKASTAKSRKENRAAPISDRSRRSE
jgi:hypothetical protein